MNLVNILGRQKLKYFNSFQNRWTIPQKNNGKQAFLRKTTFWLNTFFFFYYTQKQKTAST